MHINTNKVLTKIITRCKKLIYLIRKVFKFVNLLNNKVNFLLKLKKETISKTIMYFEYSFIKVIVDMLRIIFQGKAVRSRYLSSNYLID